MIGCLLDVPPPPWPAPTGPFRIGVAAESWQLRAHFALRQAVFCDEQRLFVTTDRDALDARATPIVAISAVAGNDDEVVGTVRIDERSPGVWFGSRLAVDPRWRGAASLAAGLVRYAVTTARGRGARAFLAHVQPANVPLFRRLHWHGLGDELVCGRPHRLMRADLAHYPPADRAAP